MNTSRQSFLSKSKKRKISSFEFCSIDENEDPLDIVVKIITKFCQDETAVECSSHIAFLNIFVGISPKLQKHPRRETVYLLLFQLIKISLWNCNRLVRAAGLRCLRHLIIDRESLEWFLMVRLDFLVMSCLELSYEDAVNCKYRSNEDIERVQAIRLLFRVFIVSVEHFPDTLLASLMDIVLAEVDRVNGAPDVAFNPALMILCQLLIVRPELCHTPQLLRTLQSVFNSPPESLVRRNLTSRIAEALILTQLKLLTVLPWRLAFPIAHFHKMLSQFAVNDKENIKQASLKESNYTSQLYEVQPIDMCITVLSTLLQTWTGLLYVTDSEHCPLPSLFGMLKLGNSSTRSNILRLLYELFGVTEPPSNTDDFRACLRHLSTQNCAENCPHWCLEEDFVVGECLDCLPYLSPSRLSIRDNFQACLLGLLTEYGLLEALVCVIGCEETAHIAVRAGLLFGCLLYKASVLLPSDHPLMEKMDPQLLLADPRCHRAIFWTQQIHNCLENSSSRCTSPFLAGLLKQGQMAANDVNISCSSSNVSGPESSVVINRFLVPSNMEEIVEMGFIGNSNEGSGTFMKKRPSIGRPQNLMATLMDHVMNYSHLFDSPSTKTTTAADQSTPDYDSWDWDLIMAFISNLVAAPINNSIHRDPTLYRIIRKLLSFLTGLNYSSNEIPASSPDCPITRGNSITRHPSISTQALPSLPLTWQYSDKAALVLTDIVGYVVSVNARSVDTALYGDLQLFLASFKLSLDTNIAKYIPATCSSEARQDAQARVLFKDYELNYKCSSYLFLAIGSLTRTDHGEKTLVNVGILPAYKTLLQQERSLPSTEDGRPGSKFNGCSEFDEDDCTDPLSMLSCMGRLLLASLDYTRPAIGRALFTTAATSFNVHLRRYTARFCRVMLRTKVTFFGSWGIKVLMKLLQDEDQLVSEEAFSVLQEACEDEAMMYNFQIEKMNILHLGYPGCILFSRMLSLPTNFENLELRESTDLFLDTWKQKYNEQYCRQLDESLMSVFTNYELPSVLQSNPDCGRPSTNHVARSIGSSKTGLSELRLMLPAHPYSSLAEHREGLDKLIGRGDLTAHLIELRAACREISGEMSEIICEEEQEDLTATDAVAGGKPRVSEWLEKERMELRLRASMLALCSVASTYWGSDWALEVDLYCMIVMVTVHHSSLNVRGTGVLCLGLLGSTRQGADNFPMDWRPVRSDRIDKWPLLLDVFHQWSVTRAEIRNIKQKEHQEPTSVIQPDIRDTSSSLCETEVNDSYSVFAPTYKAASSSSLHTGLHSSSCTNSESMMSGNTSRKISRNPLSEEDDPDNLKGSEPQEYYSMDLSKRPHFYSKPIRPNSSYLTINESQNNNKVNQSASNNGDPIPVKKKTSFGPVHTCMHIRNRSLGNASSIYTGSDSGMTTPALIQKGTPQQQHGISPSDVMGLLTLKKIRKRMSRSYRDNVDSLSIATSSMQQMGLSTSGGVYEMDVDEELQGNGDQGRWSRRNKKMSSVINTRGHLSKYRALSVPLDFSVLVTEINKPCHYQKTSCTHASLQFHKISMKGVNCPGEQSSLSPRTLTESVLFDLKSNLKEARSKSDELQQSSTISSNQINTGNSRPRAITIETDLTTPQANNNQHPTQNPSSEINNMCFHRNTTVFLKNSPPKLCKNHVETGLRFHSSAFCVHFNCYKAVQSESSSSSPINQSRESILRIISQMLSLSPRTRNLELSLARLKSSGGQSCNRNDPCQGYDWWNDLCVFSEVCTLFTLYRYSRSARQFIFELFQSDCVPSQLQNDLKFFLVQLSDSSNIRCSLSTRL